MKHNLRRQPPQGLTLLELVVGMAILVALASSVVPRLSTTGDDARSDVTHETLRQLQDVILNRYMPDMRNLYTTSSSALVQLGLPGPDPDHLQPSGRTQAPQLVFLFLNPTTNT